MSTSAGYHTVMSPACSSSSATHVDSERVELLTPPTRFLSSGTVPIPIADAARKRAKEIIDANFGFLLVVGSQALLSMVNIVVKQLSSIDPPVSVFELVWVRMTITYLFSVGFMFRSNIGHPFFGPPGVRALLSFRGFSGFVSLFGIYFSIQHLSVSDATVITFLTPLCTALAGSLFLEEVFTKKEAFAGFASLLGVVLIARPRSLFGHGNAGPISPSYVGFGGIPKLATSTNQRTLAVVIAMIGVLGAAGAYTSTRAIGKRAHPLHCLVYYSIASVVFSTVGIVVTKTPIVVPTKAEWIALLGLIGVLGFTAQLLLNMGLQRETASRCSMAIYTQIVFATSMEAIFFHVVPTLLSGAGAVMILGSGIWVVLSKSQQVPNQAPAHSIDDDELERGLLEEDEDDLKAAPPRI